MRTNPTATRRSSSDCALPRARPRMHPEALKRGAGQGCTMSTIRMDNKAENSALQEARFQICIKTDSIRNSLMKPPFSSNRRVLQDKHELLHRLFFNVTFFLSCPENTWNLKKTYNKLRIGEKCIFERRNELSKEGEHRAACGRG